MAGLMAGPVYEIATDPVTGEHVHKMKEAGGVLYYMYQGVKLGIYPPLIFFGVGAMTDFGPLIANPRSILLGAAAQLGIFTTFIGAILLNLVPGFPLPFRKQAP
jgi:oxaloacetate decarboxylase beta subunit